MTNVRLVLVLSCLGGVAAMSGVQGLAPAMPMIQDQFSLSDSAVGWFTTVYLVPGVVLAFPLGVVGDLVGRRVVWLAGGVVFGIAGAGCALATTYPVVLALRVVQGLGFAAILPLTITILGDAFVGVSLLRAQGRRAVAMVSGDFALPLVGAVLVGVAWQAPLVAQLVMVPVAVVGFFVLPADAPRRRMSGDYRAKLTDAMRQRGMGFVLSIGMVRFLFKFTTLTYLPLLLVREHGATATQAGVVLSVSALAAAATATQMPALVRRSSVGTLAMAALGCVGTAFVLFAVVPVWWASLAVGVLYGVGDGVVSVIQDTFVAQSVDHAVRAGAIALSGSAKNSGKLAAPLIMSGLVAVVDVDSAFLVMASFAVAAVAMAAARRDLPFPGLALPEHAVAPEP